MSVLDRKLRRDLWRLKGQALAICLVMGCGVATLIMSLSTLTSLRSTRSAYYARYRFAEVFAHLKRGPRTLRSRIAAIPGVGAVDTRVVEDVTLDVPGLAEPAIGRLISVPARGEPALNHTHLRSGRRLEPGRAGEVLCSEAFAEAHGFGPGDSFNALLNGRSRRLTIVGVVLSPEYVYQVRPGELLPDDKRFGVFWIEYRQLAAAFDMEGAFNDLTLTMQPGASEDEIIRQVDEVLGPYGGLGAYTRHNHESARYLSEEIKQLGGMGFMLPMIFLGVSAFLLNVVMSRLVSTEREQIAVLKAFGYTRREIGGHYFKLVMLISLVGVVAGTAVGVWLGVGMTRLYVQFYRFPLLCFELEGSVVALGALVSAGAAMLGVARAVHRAVSMPPAEGMRPRPPAIYRPTMLERLGMQRWLSQTWRMVLRHLERQPVKAGLTCLGIAMATSILIVGSFSKDALDYMMDMQFNVIERYDAAIGFVKATPWRAMSEIGHIPHIMQAEPFRAVPVKLRHAHLSRRLALTGIEPGARLHRLVDRDLNEIHLPAGGVVMSAKLGELLDVGIGDTLTVEVLEGARPVKSAVVAGMVDDFSGLAAYMDVRSLNTMMDEQPTVSGAFVRIEPGQEGTVYATLKRLPFVAGVTIKRAAWKSFQDTIAENMLRMRAFNIVFAAIIACGVVYNSARVSLSERGRELATLRVIGFTRGEISSILLGELGVLTLIAIPTGLLIGYWLAAWIIAGLDTDMYRIPLVVTGGTYAFASIVTVVAALVSGLIVRRRIDRLDLIAVLKTRE